MNALYNAPCDEHMTPLYKNVNREENITVDREASVFVGSNSGRLVISCLDRYGSLKRPALLNHLLVRLEYGQASSNSERAGAGLGIKIIMENSVDFYVLSVAKQLTLFICIIDLGMSQTKLGAIPKNVHLGFF